MGLPIVARGQAVWEIITDKGRLITGVQVRFEDNELKIGWVRMAMGESCAILLDRARSQARLFAPLELCRKLALKHGYEIIEPDPPCKETFAERIERLLGLL